MHRAIRSNIANALEVGMELRAGTELVVVRNWKLVGNNKSRDNRVNNPQ